MNHIQSPSTMKNYSSTNKLTCWTVNTSIFNNEQNLRIIPLIWRKNLLTSSSMNFQLSCFQLNSQFRKSKKFAKAIISFIACLNVALLWGLVQQTCYSNNILQTLPKHCFITWLGITNRLAIKEKLVKWMPPSTVCLFWANPNYIFFECPFAVEVWK